MYVRLQSYVVVVFFRYSAQTATAPAPAPRPRPQPNTAQSPAALMAKVMTGKSVDSEGKAPEQESAGEPATTKPAGDALAPIEEAIEHAEAQETASVEQHTEAPEETSHAATPATPPLTKVQPCFVTRFDDFSFIAFSPERHLRERT